jgi:hypothetical protein
MNIYFVYDKNNVDFASKVDEIEEYIEKIDKKNAFPYLASKDDFLKKDNYDRIIDNFAQYIDICRPKYKSAIINIEDKSGGNLILAKKDTIPIIFESSYLETFNESTLYSINEFYKYGREIYLYNPITLRFYCVSSGNNDESGLPELDIEKYGFKKASKVEESLLFEYSKTKW